MRTSSATARQQLADLPRVDWAAELSRHERWLKTVIANRVGEFQAVDEVLQEVSLAACAQRAPLADPEKVAPWLYRQAVVQSLLYRRRQGRRKKLLERFSRRTTPQSSPDPLTWIIADERRAMVRRAIAGLSPRDAEILLLKYTEDWSYHELARHLGISHSAVEARLHRARARLREQLTDVGLEPDGLQPATAESQSAAVHRPHLIDKKISSVLP